MKIAIGSDHAGFLVKKELLLYLTGAGYAVEDMGAFEAAPSDYPDFAAKVAHAVANGRCERGLLACGSGLGMCVAANKVKGIRAVTPWSVPIAKLAAQHNWANILCVPSRFVALPIIKKMVEAWLTTPFDSDVRHQRRIKKIKKIELKS